LKNETSKPKGFTVLELMIALTIIAVVMVAFYMAFSVALSWWKKGQSSLDANREMRIVIPELYETLKTAKRVIDVSLASSTDGYIWVEDVNGKTFVVFKNSLSNQAKFMPNTFPNDTILWMQGSPATSNPTLLLEGIQSFKVLTYAEDSSFFRIASVNNNAAPVNFESISSLKLFVGKTQQTGGGELQQLVLLARSRIKQAGGLLYGTGHDGVALFSFGPQTGYNGFTVSNILVSPDQIDSLVDGVSISPTGKTVKIRNTGLYFSTIQEAINAAVSGNEVLVAEKSGGYEEAIVLKNGIKLLGGYDAVTWVRNPTVYATVLRTKAGVTDKAIVVRSNTLVDGFVIDGNGLLYGIYARNAFGFVVKNCAIANVDRAFDVSVSSGEISNNVVTANEYSVLITNVSSPFYVLRNRLYSLNVVLKPNIYVKDSLNIEIRNNIVINGYACLQIDGVSVAGSSAVVANNIFQNADNISVVSLQSTLQLVNNVIHHNNIGLYYQPYPSGSIEVENNYFINNTFGATSGGIPLTGTNVIQTVSEGTWTGANPYFSSITTYLLSNSSVLIDAGRNLASFNDLYTGGVPNKGTAVNDIGVYGGPFGGRVGLGQIVPITTLDSQTDIQTKVNAAFPADRIVFDSGTISLSNMLVLKPWQQVWGASTFDTVLSLASTGFQTQTGVSIENMTIKANGQQAILINTGSVEVKSCVILNADIGVFVQNTSKATVIHSTFYSNTTAIRTSNSGLSVERSLFQGSDTGIRVDSGTVVARHSSFFSNSSNTVGSITLINASNADPKLRDPSNDYFDLLSSSPAINSTGNMDTGAVEYYLTSGVITSPYLQNNVYAGYKKIQVTLFGNTGTYPSSIDSRLGQIELAVLSKGQSVTLSPVINVFSNATATLEWDLPPTMISKQFQIRVALRTFRFNKTPYINSIKVTW